MDGIVSYEIRDNGLEMTKLDLRTYKILGRSRAVFEVKEKRVADDVKSSGLCDGLAEGGQPSHATNSVPYLPHHGKSSLHRPFSQYF